MADPVDSSQAEAEQKEAALVAYHRAQASVPRHRFGLAYLALAAILGAAVGLFVVFASNGGKDSSTAWSAWEPTKDGVERLDEIGRYVSHQYALPSGRVLVTPFSTPPVVRLGNQLAAVRAIRITTGLPGESVSDSQIIDATKVWAYELCGGGKDCALSDGNASASRGRLLQRQSLELALYTFKFEPAIDYVVAYFPPVPKSDPAAIVLTRQALEEPLKHPLAQTLPPPRTRLMPGQLSGQDLAVLDRYITRAYSFAGEQLQDGSPVLVLRPAAS
jgi:hypothetical protein